MCGTRIPARFLCDVLSYGAVQLDMFPPIVDGFSLEPIL